MTVTALRSTPDPGPSSYIDTGGPGRPALFVHGLATSSYLWRNVIADLDQQRRCVAIDLPLHGQTPAAAGQDLSLPGLARFVADCCDALELADVDLVANDTGGAIAQVFAASHPDRLHTLTLTNCEAHDNVPPPGLRTMHLLARADQALGIGLLARLAPRLVRSPAARTPHVSSRLRGSHQPARRHRSRLARTAPRQPGTRCPIPAHVHSIRADDLLNVEPALTQLESSHPDRLGDRRQVLQCQMGLLAA